MKTYTVRAYRSQETVDSGCDYDTTEDTLKEAKERARYCTSEEFRKSGEMSARFGYAMVTTEEGGCVFDYCAK